jgi:hypothetical protein
MRLRGRVASWSAGVCFRFGLCIFNVFMVHADLQPLKPHGVVGGFDVFGQRANGYAVDPRLRQRTHGG